MATQTLTTKQNVMGRFEDALQLIISLRGSKEAPSDIALGSVQRKLEEGLAAFDELWQTVVLAKSGKRSARELSPQSAQNGTRV